METMTCLDIQKKVKEILEADHVLSQYVEVFDVGAGSVARKRFPYVTVEEVTGDVQGLCIGANAANLNNYRVVLRGGTYHTLPEIARAGNSDGKKGAVQLMDDIITALWPGTLDGTFNKVMKLESASANAVSGAAGRSWTARVELSGFRKA